MSYIFRPSSYPTEGARRSTTFRPGQDGLLRDVAERRAFVLLGVRKGDYYAIRCIYGPCMDGEMADGRCLRLLVAGREGGGRGGGERRERRERRCSRNMRRRRRRRKRNRQTACRRRMGGRSMGGAIIC